MITINNTSISDVKILEPSIYKDKRGYFFESFNNNDFKKYFNDVKFIQDNESKSDFGVLRGFHFQKPPYEQTKLVRVIKGEIQDVIIDLRLKSPTYKKHFSIILNDQNKKQLFIPKGFAHAFLVLSNDAIVAYKVDNFYREKYDSGIRFDDPTFNIKWNLNSNDIIVSEKDRNLPYF